MALRGVSIIGIGSTRFGVLEGESLKSMAVSACNDAIQDAGIDRKQIQSFYLGNYISGMVLG
jgi:acetyl-CoA acetyltransferase